MDVRVGLWRKLSAKELMLLNCGVGEDSWESLGLKGDPASPSLRRSVPGVHWKDQRWSWNSVKSWLIGKDPGAGRDWGQEEKGTTEDEMAGWHHRLDGHKFKWTPGVGDEQGGLACCNSWGLKELDMTERLNWTELRVRVGKRLEMKLDLANYEAKWWEHGVSQYCAFQFCIYWKFPIVKSFLN